MVQSTASLSAVAVRHAGLVIPSEATFPMQLQDLESYNCNSLAFTADAPHPQL
jgi:hypothetical protein